MYSLEVRRDKLCICGVSDALRSNVHYATTCQRDRLICFECRGLQLRPKEGLIRFPSSSKGMRSHTGTGPIFRDFRLRFGPILFDLPSSFALAAADLKGVRDF
jgi:hypothetical protein